MTNVGLPISEIFYSIQGEGFNLGRPSVFVRIAGCNLSCSFCDSKYSWKVSDEDYWTVEKILNDILQYDSNRIVLTGGEPLLYQPELTLLCQELRKKNNLFHIDVETNGTILPYDFFMEIVDHMTISPKKSMRKKEWKTFLRKYRNKVHFKFVYIEENKELIKKTIKYLRLLPGEVYLMSEGTNRDELLKKDLFLVELCKQLGVMFTPRLQIYLWGNVRGK